MPKLDFYTRGKFSFSHKVDVTCSHCGALNIVNSDIAKNGGCKQCLLPLNWSLPKGTYVPNFIPVTRRIKYLLVSITLMALSGYALVQNNMYLPYGSKSHAVLVHFSGLGLIFPILALLCGLLAGVSVLIDHCDMRPNESFYKEIYSWGLGAGWLCYFLALFSADGVAKF